MSTITQQQIDAIDSVDLRLAYVLQCLAMSTRVSLMGNIKNLIFFAPIGGTAPKAVIFMEVFEVVFLVFVVVEVVVRTPSLSSSLLSSSSL